MRTRYLVLLIVSLFGMFLLWSITSAAQPLVVTTYTASVSPAPLPTATLPWLSVASSQSLAAPDLIVESIIFSPAHPDVGAGVDITVTVKNQGDAVASGFYVHLYVDPADRPPTTITAYTSRTYWGIPLNPGGSFKWTRTNHTFVVSGTHPVYAWVDRDNNVAESDETNNLSGPVNIPVGVAYTPDGYEDDDLCSQAQWISTDGAEQQRNLYPVPDKDWARFSVVGGVTYHVQAIADGTDADLVVELYSTCSSPPSFGSGAEFEFTAPANGTYYVKIEHVLDDYGPDTAYRLRITAQNACNAYHEPNNACTAASDIAVDQAAQVHSFCEQGDVDWTAVPVQAGSTYVISATNTGPNADVQLELHLTCSSPPAFGAGQRIEYTARASGMVFVKTENLSPTVYGPGTDYALQVVRIHECGADAYEDDDTASKARSLTVGGAAQTHNVCPAGEADWASFAATGGVTYTIETLNLGLAADTRLCLYDTAGTTQLACDDDSGAGKGSRITWRAPASGTYVLRVTDYDTSVAGPETRYDLRVFVGLCLPDSLEPDNTLATARPIIADGSLQAHNTCPIGDVDWASFSANTGSYVIETTDLGPEADTLVELYDASGRQLAFNDDYGPGEASRMHYAFGSAGTYYVRMHHYDPSRYGTGTEYSLRIKPGEPPTPTPTPTPPPTVTPTPTPPPSGVRTIILVNRARVTALHGETSASQLMDKLNTLAIHNAVRGEVIRLDLNETASAAYANWVADLTDVDKANQVVAAIRGVIMTYLQQHDGVEYIVLVGDDRLLPFRRVADHTPRNDYIERDYLHVDNDHPTGAALHANYFLTDDYYADREPTPFRGREWYIPDLAIGRLVETPNEIMAFIDTFLAGSEVTLGKVLATGYDFVQDTASANCRDWQAELGAGNVDCALIGDSWTMNEYRARQLQASPPFKVQSINGHASHYREGAPGFGQFIGADEIAAASADLRRGLIYTLGCHSGLNVPPDNAVGPLDLAQAFAQKGVNYVANTGYGWGLRGEMGLSERLMRLYTEELRRGTQVGLGQALAVAKRRYYQEEQNLTGYDEKILQEAVFYGLPMYRLNTPDAFDPTDNPFPSVEIASGLPEPGYGEAILSGTIDLHLIGALGPGDIMSQVVTADGIYYQLDGHTHVVPEQPAQPLLYADVTVSDMPAWSVVFRGGAYESLEGFDPFVVSPVNDYLTQTAEIAFDEPGWFPPIPVGLQAQGNSANLVVQMGQYDPSSQQVRLYSAMQFDLYYSLSTDQTPPTVTVVSGLYNHASGLVNVKVGAIDVAGIRRVVATYTQGDGNWNSVELNFNPALYKWTGSFPGGDGVRYFVQVVDGAGNVAHVTNKGLYLTPAKIPAPGAVYLPLVLK